MHFIVKYLQKFFKSISEKINAFHKNYILSRKRNAWQTCKPQKGAFRTHEEEQMEMT